MKLSRTFWLMLGIGLFVVAAVVLYMAYQDQTEKRQEAEDTIAAAEAVIDNLKSDNDDLGAGLAQLEAELVPLEAELAQWQITIGGLADEMSLLEVELSQLEDERAQAILRAIALLDETAAKFISQVESIEYDETLFGFADDSNLVIESLIVADPSSEVEGDITYYNTKFTVTVRGEVADILGFINILVTDNDFKTTILEPIAITVPEPLTDKEKEDMKEQVREELTAEATAEVMAELTIEDRLGFYLEAIEEVTGVTVDVNTLEEIAGGIRDAIAGADQDIVDMLPEDLAELILQHVYDSLNAVVDPVAQKLTEMILGEDPEDWEAALEDLLGMTIAVPDWLQDFVEELEAIVDQIEIGKAGALKSNIVALLKGYIAELAEEKMTNFVASQIDTGLIEELVVERVAEEVEAQEMPSATINISIYTYEGEGE